MDTAQIPIPGTHKYSRKGPASEKSHQDIRNSNYWAPLMEIASEDTTELLQNVPEIVDKVAERWEEGVHGVAQRAGIRGKETGKAAPLKPKIASAIAKRQRVFRDAMRTSPSQLAIQKWEQHHECTKLVTQLTREDRKIRWRKALKNACEDLRVDPRGFWQWSARAAGWRTRDSSSGTQPVCHPDSGVLLTQLEDIRDAWRMHYERLATDESGNSRGAEKWRALREREARGHLSGLDEDITWRELCGALKKLKRHKVPGPDGIPADFLKLSTGEDPCPMATALLCLINLVWRTGRIPESWRDSVVVSIPKKGDLTNMNDYRGISLMCTTLKALAVVVSDRISETFEKEGLFSPSQAGFRSREECPTQVGCLLEIAKRRLIKGKPTYLTFVDLKKAYDSVPHQGMLAKLFNLGVRGRTLRFIESLYDRSRITVRVGQSRTPPTALARGVRQGCLLSPVLFNIFINDVLKGAESLGVPIGEGEQRVTGLMFADDLVCINPTRRKTVRIHRKLDE